MITTKLTKQIFESKIFIFSIFTIYFFIGISIYKDFGISFDENINRINGFVWLKYLFVKLGINIDLSLFVNNLPNLDNYFDKEYGIVFDLPLAFLEVILNPDNSRDIYLLKHLANFIVFFISSICFFLLCNHIFKDQILSLIGLAALILSPRIFAESFYNPKDIIFMCFLIFAIYFNIKFLQYKNNFYIIFAALFSALMTDIKVVGIFLPFITSFFLIFNSDNFSLKVKLYSLIKYLTAFIIFVFMFWPFLWENSLSNLIISIQKFKNFPFDIEILYLGNFIKAKFVPWHYFFVWFFITTPLIFFIIIFFGVLRNLRIFIKNLVEIEKIKKNNLWKNQDEMISMYILFIFLLPIFLVIIFNSTLYSGWRQLYFLYPPLIILGIYFLKDLKKIGNQKVYKTAIIICIMQIFFSIHYLYKNHPHQHVYFNILSRGFIENKFAIDYWGVSNHTTLKYLLDDENFKHPIKISTASFTDLNKTKLILDTKYKDKFISMEDNHSNSDFIFTNYYYNTRPIVNKKRYSIPSYFKSFYRFEIDGMIVNELFINTKKYN